MKHANHLIIYLLFLSLYNIPSSKKYDENPGIQNESSTVTGAGLIPESKTISFELKAEPLNVSR